MKSATNIGQKLYPKVTPSFSELHSLTVSCGKPRLVSKLRLTSVARFEIGVQFRGKIPVIVPARSLDSTNRNIARKKLREKEKR